MDPELEKRKWYNYLANFPLVKLSISTDWANSNDEIFPHKEELIELAEMLPSLDNPPSLSKEWRISWFLREMRIMLSK